MTSNHLSSNTVPPEASTQCPSAIDSRPSSQSGDAQPTISGPGYRKHSLGDILQSPGGTNTKRTKSTAQGTNTALADYEMQMRLLEEQNKARRRIIAQREKDDSFLKGSGGMTEIAATGPEKNSTNVNTSAVQATYNFQLSQLEEQNKARLTMAQREKVDAFLNGSGDMIAMSATGPAKNSTNVTTSVRKPFSGRHREKFRIGGTSNDTTSKAPDVEKDAQKHSSPLPPVQSMFPPRELQILPSSGNHAPGEESAAQNFGLDELNCGAIQLKRLATAIEETKIRIDQEVDKFPKIVEYVEQAKALLSAEENSITQRQIAMIDKKEAEGKTLEAKFEELIAITSGIQKEALQKIKDDAILTLQREIDDLRKGEDPFTRALKGSKAQLEWDLRRVKGHSASLIEALEGLLEKLP